MGKTAIAEMIGLAQMTNGWQVHECLTPEQLAGMFDASEPQVSIADDAFGSTGALQQPPSPLPRPVNSTIARNCSLPSTHAETRS
jgi:hypothetical protein